MSRTTRRPPTQRPTPNPTDNPTNSQPTGSPTGAPASSQPSNVPTRVTGAPTRVTGGPTPGTDGPTPGNAAPSNANDDSGAPTAPPQEQPNLFTRNPSQYQDLEDDDIYFDACTPEEYETARENGDLERSLNDFFDGSNNEEIEQLINSGIECQNLNQAQEDVKLILGSVALSGPTLACFGGLVSHIANQITHVADLTVEQGGQLLNNIITCDNPNDVFDKDSEGSANAAAALILLPIFGVAAKYAYTKYNQYQDAKKARDEATKARDEATKARDEANNIEEEIEKFNSLYATTSGPIYDIATNSKNDTEQLYDMAGSLSTNTNANANANSSDELYVEPTKLERGEFKKDITDLGKDFKKKNENATQKETLAAEKEKIADAKEKLANERFWRCANEEETTNFTSSENPVYSEIDEEEFVVNEGFYSALDDPKNTGEDGGYLDVEVDDNAAAAEENAAKEAAAKAAAEAAAKAAAEAAEKKAARIAKKKATEEKAAKEAVARAATDSNIYDNTTTSGGLQDGPEETYFGFGDDPTAIDDAAAEATKTKKEFGGLWTNSETYEVPEQNQSSTGNGGAANTNRVFSKTRLEELAQKPARKHDEVDTTTSTLYRGNKLTVSQKVKKPEAAKLDQSRTQGQGK